MKVISLESIRGVIRSPATYGTTLAFLGAVGIFTYVASHDRVLRLKEEGENYISIQLSAFAPPSKDKIADIIQKPKPKKHRMHKHKKKKHHEIQSPSKPIESLLQAKREAVEEKPQEELVREEAVTKDTTPQEDTKTPEAEVATTVKSSPDANSDRNIKMLRASDGMDDPFLKAIRVAIERRNEYPQLARSRGYEDTVFLRFVVNLDGSISDAQVYKKSRYEVLNKAAMKALRKASHSFPKPTEVTYIEIPLEYSLEKL